MLGVCDGGILLGVGEFCLTGSPPGSASGVGKSVRQAIKTRHNGISNRRMENRVAALGETL
jgi:hypothetical protein